MKKKPKPTKEEIGDNFIWEGEDMDDEADAAWAEKVMEDVRRKLPDLFKREAR